MLFHGDWWDACYSRTRFIVLFLFFNDRLEHSIRLASLLLQAVRTRLLRRRKWQVGLQALMFSNELLQVEELVCGRKELADEEDVKLVSPEVELSSGFVQLACLFVEILCKTAKKSRLIS